MFKITYCNIAGGGVLSKESNPEVNSYAGEAR